MPARQLNDVQHAIRSALCTQNITRIPGLYQDAYQVLPPTQFEQLILWTYHLFTGFPLRPQKTWPPPKHAPTTAERFTINTYTPNPALDLCVDFSQVSPQGITLDPGGKGLNISVGLSGWGIPVHVWGYLGGMNGRIVAELLKQKHLDTKRILPLKNDTRINLSVHSGRQDLIHFTQPGPTLDSGIMPPYLEQLSGSLRTGDVLVLSSSLAPGMPDNHYASLIQGAHQAGAISILDTSGPALLQGIAACPSILSINEEELRQIMPGPSLIATARQLLATGIKQVLISRGKDGLLLVTERGCWLAQGPVQTEVSSVGAGDSIKTAWIYGHTLGWDELTTLKLATGASGLTVTKPGSQLAGRDESLGIAPRIAIRAVSTHGNDSLGLL